MRGWRSRFSGFLLLALLLGSPVAAQGQTNPSANKASGTSSKQVDELAEARTRAQELAQSNAILEAKAELSDAAYSRLEILIGAFGAVIGLLGALITGIVIFFSMRTKNEAIAEARNTAAEVAKADSKTAIDAAQSDFSALLAQERSNVAEIEAKLAEARHLVTAISGLQADALKGKEAIEADANRLAELTTRLAEEAKGGSKPDLSEDDRKVLEKASEAAKDTAQNQWTAKQFRAAISKAQFVDRDWPRVAELAEDMARLHGENDEDFTYAMNELGDALLNRRAFVEAHAAYRQVIDRLEQSDRAELRSRLYWALHHAGCAQTDAGNPRLAEPMFIKALDLACDLYGPEGANTLATRDELARLLLKQGRAAEAEDEFRAMLPLVEKVHGPEASNTLSTRHELASAVLEQGRAAEAEAEFRAILPLVEKVDGPETLSTLATRHALARAVLDQGRGAEAEAELRTILWLTEKVDGPEESDTLITRHVLACAILDQDRAAEAEAELRAILSLTEKVDGPDASVAHVTRYVLALAVLENGDPAGAQALLEVIPDLSARPDWPHRHAARLAYVRGKVADALSQRKDATAHLAEARRIYCEHFPEDYVYRRQLEDYIAQRGGL